MAKKPAAIKTDFGDAPPIIYTIDNDQYHESSGVSRSSLWTLYKHTPYKMKFGEKKNTRPMALGTLAGTAILEPEDFESRYMPTKVARRGTKDWEAAEAAAKEVGAELVKQDDYDKALAMRDSIFRKHTFRDVMDGAKIEQAAYVIDPVTGVLCKCKPDIFNPRLHLLCDLKTAANISEFEFGRSIYKYGYHVQESFYMDCWRQVSQIDGYFFAVIESEPPYDVAFYEIPPKAHAEGAAIHRQALNTYAECLKADKWPGRPDQITPCDIPRYGYENTNPDEEDEGGED